MREVDENRTRKRPSAPSLRRKMSDKKSNVCKADEKLIQLNSQPSKLQGSKLYSIDKRVMRDVIMELEDENQTRKRHQPKKER